MILTIKLKGITPESTYEDKIIALQASAMLMQGLNQAMQVELIHGPIKCNPDAMIKNEETGEWAGQMEGFLGDVNGLPNELGILDVTISNYTGMDIPYLPMESPFALSTGDTSREIPTEEVDEEGNPVFKTILSGGIL